MGVVPGTGIAGDAVLSSQLTATARPDLPCQGLGRREAEASLPRKGCFVRD